MPKFNLWVYVDDKDSAMVVADKSSDFGLEFNFYIKTQSKEELMEAVMKKVSEYYDKYAAQINL